MSNIRDKYDDNDIKTEKRLNRLPVIASGFDPYFVIFYDNSIHRSYETNNWYWDFGDYVYYGYTECERLISGDSFTSHHCVTGDEHETYSNISILGMFELSGDGAIVDEMNKVDTIYDAYQKTVIDKQLASHYALMVPLNGHAGTYPSTKNWTKHYTGIWMRSSNDDPSVVDPTETTVTVDNGCLYASECEGHECTKTNVRREIGTHETPVNIGRIRALRDSCGNASNRTQCYSNDGNVMDNSVYHVYKGAGVYPVSMKTYLTWVNRHDDGEELKETVGKKLISASATDIDETDPEKIDNVYAQDALVVVAPVCPCISGIEVTNDKFSIGITSEFFSCASAGCFGDEYWDTVIGILGGFTTQDKDDPDKMRYITTGYGPFVHVTVSGDVQPRSMPVTAFDWLWDDWFIDQDCVADYYWMGDVVGGWSTNWATLYPSDYTPIHDNIETCHVYRGVRNFFGQHTFTIPGCYHISCRPHVDYTRLPPILWDFVEKPDCEAIIDLGEKIMVREVKPKFADPDDPIHVTKDKIDANTVDVYVNVFERLVPGSYPIGRIDWDFHDGSDVASIYRYDYMDTDEDFEKYQQYYNDKFEPNITSGHAMEGLKVDHNGAKVDYRCWNLNYFTGNGIGKMSTDTVYKETCPETWMMYHRFTKNEIDNGTRTISVTAYAEDTMSPCSAEIVLDLFSVYADPEAGEGVARVIDTRLHDDTTLIVFEGDKTKQLYTTKL